MKQGQGSRRSRGHRGPNRRTNFGGRGSTVESNGPEGKIRGTVHQVIEKYQALARDATASGDRVAAENFYQHAEHYQRVVTANGWDQQPRQDQRPDQKTNEQRGDQRNEQRSDQRNEQRNEPREAQAGGNGAGKPAEAEAEKPAAEAEVVAPAADAKPAETEEEHATAS